VNSEMFEKINGALSGQYSGNEIEIVLDDPVI
jgi:hypothetical protein